MMFEMLRFYVKYFKDKSIDAVVELGFMKFHEKSNPKIVIR